LSDTGEVDRSTVIMVLRANQVQISKLNDENDELYTLIKGDRVEVQKLASYVSRRLLQYFQYHFEVPIHYFYHPEMMPRTEKIQ